MKNIYIASKVKHFQKWIDLREMGVNIISSWIDEAGQGESEDLKDLMHRIGQECLGCDIMIVYREPGEDLIGAYIEMGIAMANNAMIFMVGPVLKEHSVFRKYTWLVQCHSIVDVLGIIRTYNLPETKT